MKRLLQPVERLLPITEHSMDQPNPRRVESPVRGVFGQLGEQVDALAAYLRWNRRHDKAGPTPASSLGRGSLASWKAAKASLYLPICS